MTTRTRTKNVGSVYAWTVQEREERLEQVVGVTRVQRAVWKQQQEQCDE